MSEKREAYIQKLKAKLDEWNAEIDKLAAEVDQAEADSKIEYDKRLEDLRARRKDLEEKLAELQQAGDSAWNDLKKGVENSWIILKESMAKAKSEFERGYREGRKEKIVWGSGIISVFRVPPDTGDTGLRKERP